MEQAHPTDVITLSLPSDLHLRISEQAAQANHTIESFLKKVFDHAQHQPSELAQLTVKELLRQTEPSTPDAISRIDFYRS